MTKKTLGRRDFIKSSILVAGAFSIPKLVLANPIKNYFELTATKTPHTFLKGATTSELWTFNGKVSGPEIRAVQGEEITVVFINELDEPTSIHWHGIRIDNKMDGVSGLTQQAVKPGEKFIYKFTVPDAGTFWYHAHNKSWSHVARGLYGSLIIDEPIPLFDKEHDLVLQIDDWRLDNKGRLDIKSLGSLMEWSHEGRLGNFITANGVYKPVLHLNKNETYRLRIINVANSRILTLDLNPLEYQVIAYDGQTLPALETKRKQPITLAPAQRIDLLISPSIVGQIQLNNIGRGKPYNIANFAVTKNDSRLTSIPKLKPNNIANPILKNAKKEKIIIQGGAMSRMSNLKYNGKRTSMMESMQNKQVWGLNGVANLEKTPMFEIKLGKTIIIDFKNDTAFSHAMHIHGHHFKIISRNDKPQKNDIWLDTFLIEPNGAAKIAFVADNPGKWLLHCHMLEHAAGGMNTWFNII